MKVTASNWYPECGYVRASLTSCCLIMLVAVVLQVSGCADNAEVAPASMVETGLEHGRRPPSGKPEMPLSVTYELEGKPVVGNTLHLTVRVSSDIDTDSLRIHVLPEPGLLLDPPDSVNFGPLSKRKSRRFGVSFVPQREGVFRIRLAFSLDQQGIGQSSMLSVPVSIGANSALRSPDIPQGAKTGSDEEGRPLIVFPAKSR